MKKNKLIVVGAINEGGVATCGETRKNQLFISRFKELFDVVITVDTRNWQKRPWILVRLFFVLLFNRGAKVVISASGAASYLITFLHYIPLKNQVYYWAIGGNLHIKVHEGHYNLKALATLQAILVEGKSMVAALNEVGLTNVIYVPNAKPITFTPIITPKRGEALYRFVFLSRIHPHKGVKEICDAVNLLNQQGFQSRFYVEFYGKVESDFERDFARMIATSPNMSYKGFLDLTTDEGYRQLSSYDAMLFPTYWRGEGFPGVVLDANMAGLPIIATDWNLNKEVVEDGVTGFIIPVHDSQALADCMLKFIREEVDLMSMKQRCVDYIQQYDVKNVLSIDLMQRIGAL